MCTSSAPLWGTHGPCCARPGVPCAGSGPATLLARALALAADPVPNVRLALARLLAGVAHAAQTLNPAPRDDALAGPGTPPACGARSSWAATREDSCGSNGAGPGEALEGGLLGCGCCAAPSLARCQACSAASIRQGPGVAADGGDIAVGSQPAAQAGGAAVSDNDALCAGGLQRRPLTGPSRMAGFKGDVAAALERLAGDEDRDVAGAAAAGLSWLGFR